MPSAELCVKYTIIYVKGEENNVHVCACVYIKHPWKGSQENKSLVVGGMKKMVAGKRDCSLYVFKYVSTEQCELIYLKYLLKIKMVISKKSR